MLLAPLSLSRYGSWVKFYTHGSELVIEGDKITGIRCYPKVWEEMVYDRHSTATYKDGYAETMATASLNLT